MEKKNSGKRCPDELRLRAARIAPILSANGSGMGIKELVLPSRNHPVIRVSDKSIGRETVRMPKDLAIGSQRHQGEFPADVQERVPAVAGVGQASEFGQPVLDEGAQERGHDLGGQHQNGHGRRVYEHPGEIKTPIYCWTCPDVNEA